MEVEQLFLEAELKRGTVRTRSSTTTEVCFRYKCSFGKCQRVIRGDVNFVFHLWAHVALAGGNLEDLYKEMLSIKPSLAAMIKPPVEKYVERCPECLSTFLTPQLLQIHYTKVHSYNNTSDIKTTCYTCEIDLESPEGLADHFAHHKRNDAPYLCKMCGFRTNARQILINHYANRHRNSGALMCPFCLWTHALNKNYLDADSWQIKNPLITANKFVEHMWSHAVNQKTSCSGCALALTNSSNVMNKEITHLQPDQQSIQAHKTLHKFEITPQFDITTTNKRQSFYSKLTQAKAKCTECQKQISSLLRVNEVCLECNRLDFWERAYETCGVREGPKGTLYRCECGMKTTIESKLSLHFNRTNHTFQIDEAGFDLDEPEIIYIHDDELIILEEGEIIEEKTEPFKEHNEVLPFFQEDMWMCDSDVIVDKERECVFIDKSNEELFDVTLDDTQSFDSVNSTSRTLQPTKEEEKRCAVLHKYNEDEFYNLTEEIKNFDSEKFTYKVKDAKRTATTDISMAFTFKEFMGKLKAANRARYSATNKHKYKK